jgi:hypothetical protein
MYGPIVSRIPDAELEAKLVYTTRMTNTLIYYIYLLPETLV